MLLTPITLLAAPLCAPQDAPGEPVAADVPATETAAPTAPATAGDDVPTRVTTEREAYAVETIPLPEGCVLEVGGMDMTSDGTLYVCTRRGQVWRIENPLADDVADTKVTLYHEGLWEGLGLDIKDDQIYVVQRGELSRLDDLDGDGRCDQLVTVADDWGVSGHYHEFAFGLPRTQDDQWFVSLNVSFGNPEWWHGRSVVPYRGWVMRVSPDGTVEPWASGLRSPNGVALDTDDNLYITDNQGDWVASSPIYKIEKGAFYGHPKSLAWTDEYRNAGRLPHDEIPPPEASAARKSAAIWIPYEWSRSTGNLFEATTGGKTGVQDGQFVVAELTNGMILRAGFEDVQGQTQGWVTPLVQKVGSVNRVFEAPDGTIFCGLTNRGWGGLAPADGLVRVRYRGKTPMEVADMAILDLPEEGTADEADEFGFEVELSRPVAAGWEPTADTVSMIQYDYDYWWEYGSPERHTEALELAGATLSEDRKTLRLRFAGMIPAMCVRLTLKGVAAEDGSPLLHETISYTVNQLPSGAPTNAYVNKMVPPPPSRNDGSAGVLHLSWGDALEQFDANGWQHADAELAEDDRTRFETKTGNGALVRTEGDGDLVTRGSFGNMELSFDFMLTEGGAGSLVLGGGAAEIALVDDATGCGAVGGNAPAKESYPGAGQWVPVKAWYRAKTADAPATLDRVEVAGVTVQENVALEGGEGRASLRFTSNGGVALRDIRVKPMDRPTDSGDPWTFLDPAKDWDDWESVGDASFALTGEGIEAKGALGHLWVPVDGLGDVTVRFRAQVNANGAGAVIVRANETDEGVEGYALRVNGSYPGGGYSGTVTGGGVDGATVDAQLVPPDTWADFEIAVRGEEGGATRIVVRLNGVVVMEATDPEGLPAGGIAIQSDHDGSVMKVVNLRYR